MVVLSIPLILWLVKRLSLLPGRHQSGQLSIAATLSVGPRERISILQAGDRYFLIGVTSQSVSLLAELERRAESTTTTSDGSTHPKLQPHAFQPLFTFLKNRESR